jgi:hypothetical protein
MEDLRINAEKTKKKNKQRKIKIILFLKKRKWWILFSIIFLIIIFFPECSGQAIGQWIESFLGSIINHIKMI